MERPSKPHKTFPLFAHQNGQWVKKIRGKLHYFGRWADDRSGKLAKQEYMRVRDYLLDGVEPPADTGPTGGSLTLVAVCDSWLRHQQGRVAERTFEDDYRWACQYIVDYFGKARLVSQIGPYDFQRLRESASQRYGCSRLGRLVTVARMVFGYTDEMGTIDKPMRFGPAFRGPIKNDRRRERSERPKKWFEAAELRKILEAAKEPHRTWILLGLNCCFEPHDLARLELSMIDLDKGVIESNRTKHGLIERRCVLRPETIEGLRKAIAERPEPIDPADRKLALLSRTARPFGTRGSSACSQALNRLCIKCGITDPDDPTRKAPGKDWLALRNVGQTIGGACGDQVAVNTHMGHADGSMAEVYREGVHRGDERLKRVSDAIREWLWPETVKKKTRGTDPVDHVTVP